MILGFVTFFLSVHEPLFAIREPGVLHEELDCAVCSAYKYHARAQRVCEASACRGLGDELAAVLFLRQNWKFCQALGAYMRVSFFHFLFGLTSRSPSRATGCNRFLQRITFGPRSLPRVLLYACVPLSFIFVLFFHLRFKQLRSSRGISSLLLGPQQWWWRCTCMSYWSVLSMRLCAGKSSHREVIKQARATSVQMRAAARSICRLRERERAERVESSEPKAGIK